MNTVLHHDQEEEDQHPLTPRSAIRYRPIAPDVLSQGHVNTPIVPRASRKQQRNTPHTTGGPPFGAAVPLVVPARRSARRLQLAWVSLAVGMVLAVLLVWVAGILLHWAGQVADDLHYGRPRTTNADHRVGHEASGSAQLTHFIALNLDGQVYILELPGGHQTDARLLVGPKLVGADAALVPVTLDFVGDAAHPDLLIVAGEIEVRFHNTGTTFVPTT
jgi:hypothetical protein